MFSIRPLDISYLPKLLAMQEVIFEALPNRDVFQRSTEEFITYCLTGGGLCYGAFSDADDDLIAYRMVYFPRSRPFNLGAGLLPAQDIRLVAHMDTTAVLPDWRRFGIANLFNQTALSDMRSTDIRHVFATASPYNPNSVMAMLRAGLRPVRVVEKFGGKLRFLFYRPFPGEWVFDEAGEEMCVPIDDIPSLTEKLSAGYVGASLNKVGTEFLMTLRARANPFR